jgi:hypothetical protein
MASNSILVRDRYLPARIGHRQIRARIAFEMLSHVMYNSVLAGRCQRQSVSILMIWGHSFATIVQEMTCRNSHTIATFMREDVQSRTGAYEPDRVAAASITRGELVRG